MSSSSGKKRRNRVSKELRVRHYCPICGCLMDPDGSIHNSIGETKDHVFPKSLYAGTATYQLICRRCNTLKGALPPSEIIYRAIQFMRVVETEYTGLSPKGIRIPSTSNTQMSVILDFKPKAELMIVLPDYEVSWVSYSVQASAFLSTNKVKLNKLIRKVFYGPLAKRVKTDIEIRKIM